MNVIRFNKEWKIKVRVYIDECSKRKCSALKDNKVAEFWYFRSRNNAKKLHSKIELLETVDRGKQKLSSAKGLVFI